MKSLSGSLSFEVGGSIGWPPYPVELPAMTEYSLYFLVRKPSEHLTCVGGVTEELNL